MNPIRFMLQFLKRATASASDAMAIGALVTSDWAPLYWTAMAVGLGTAEWSELTQDSGQPNDQNATRLLNLVRAGKHLAHDQIADVEKLPASVQLKEIDKLLLAKAVND